MIGHWAFVGEFSDGQSVPDLATADGVQNAVIVDHYPSPGSATQPVADRRGALDQALSILYDSPANDANEYAYVHVPGVTALPSAVTLTIWIGQGTTAGSSASAGNGEGFVFGMDRGPQLYQKSYALSLQVPSSAANVTAVGSAPLTSGRWTFVAGVFMRPAGAGGTWTVSLYVDGALAASGTPANANVTPVGDLLMGGLFNCNDIVCDQGFTGSLDDARLYGRALTATEIANLYAP